jgi:hypothetical protein
MHTVHLGEVILKCRSFMGLREQEHKTKILNTFFVIFRFCNTDFVFSYQELQKVISKSK